MVENLKIFGKAFNTWSKNVRFDKIQKAKKQLEANL